MMRKLAFACMRRFVCAVGLAGVLAGCATTDGGAGESSADSELAASIRQRLSVDPAYRDQFFSVDVVGGDVTIRGTVRSEAERMRVLSIVRGTPGVTLVIDRLRVLY